jgi:multidrug efflux pump subunit AcrB
VLTVAISGDRSQRELTEIADKVVKPQVERSAGVGEVRILGGLDRAINVWVDADRLAAYQIPITAVRDAVERQNTTSRAATSPASCASRRCAPWDASPIRATSTSW